MIAETRDLPVRYIKIVVTDDQRPLRRARSAEGELQRVGARLRPRRQREGDGAARQASSNLTATPAPNDGRRRAVLPGDLLVLDAEDPGGRRVRRQERHSRANMTQTEWLNAMKNNGCVGCHQLGQLSTRTIPAVARHVRVRRRRVDAPRAVGPGRRSMMLGQLNGLGALAVRATSATGPIASPRASCRTPSRRGRRASSATSSSRCATG